MLMIEFLSDNFNLYHRLDDKFFDEIKIDEQTYTIDSESKHANGFIGFFDWLRTSKSTIIGVRIMFFDDLNYFKILSNIPYVNKTYEGKCIEIYFFKEEYVPELANDQDFSSNFFYKSENNTFLMTFNLDNLSEFELKSVLAFCNRL